MSAPTRILGRAAATLVAATVVIGCAAAGPGRPPRPGAEHARPPDTLPLPPAVVARLLESERFELDDVRPAPSGVMGVLRARARFPRGQAFEVKWKTASGGGEGWNNSPRKELAAFAIQRWFLDPDDWVVPPTAVRCIPLDDFRRLVGDAEPTIEGGGCVLGLVAAWLDHVSLPDVLYDPQRFEADHLYAARLADLNLLTYLIEHRDGRQANFLASDDPRDRRLYSIDNGIAFGNVVYNFLVANWDVIRVPALRRRSIARLRGHVRTAAEDLAVVTELRADAAGVLQPVRPGPVRDPAAGSRVAPGSVQLGLTADEIAAVTARLRDLLQRVDRGEIPLF